VSGVRGVRRVRRVRGLGVRGLGGEHTAITRRIESLVMSWSKVNFGGKMRAHANTQPLGFLPIINSTSRKIWDSGKTAPKSTINTPCPHNCFRHKSSS
jgi:hypothetical protein